MIDIPDGLALVLVAAVTGALTLAGVLVTNRRGRLADVERENERLERENRQLWFAMKRMLHTLYTNNIEPDEALVALINGKDAP